MQQWKGACRKHEKAQMIYKAHQLMYDTNRNNNIQINHTILKNDSAFDG